MTAQLKYRVKESRGKKVPAASFTYFGIARFRMQSVTLAEFVALVETEGGEIETWLVEAEEYKKELQRLYEDDGFPFNVLYLPVE